MMRVLGSIFLSAALLALAVATSTSIGSSVRAPQSMIQRLKNKVIENGGCNINVCFAIDGSGSVGQRGFDAEKGFVFDIESIINVRGPVGLAATQFGATSSPIIGFTTSAPAFRSAVNGARFLNARLTNIREGISFCVTELLKSRSGPKKIVLLTDGRANTGGDPVPLADLFRAVGGDVCAVGVGHSDDRSLLEIAGGDRDRVLNVDDFFELAGILEDLIEQVCGF